MNIEKLLETQLDLNSHCERYPDKHELDLAILAEIGELLQEIKGNWCWWKKYGEGFGVSNPEVIAAELADILCFLLVGFLQHGDRRDDLVFAEASHRLQVQPFSISFLAQAAMLGDYMLAIECLFFIGNELGINKAELETAYYKKVEINRQRWTTTSPGSADS